jgi:YD repeat-containing protein
MVAINTRYDSKGQLTEAYAHDKDGKANYVYGYDAIGNRLRSSASLRLASADFSYNALNQMTNPGYKYDAFGNLIKTPDAEYSYDLHDRLCEVRKTDGTVVTYSYDPLGQRIASEEITTKHTKYLMSGMVEEGRQVVSDTAATGGQQGDIRKEFYR